MRPDASYSSPQPPEPEEYDRVNNLEFVSFGHPAPLSEMPVTAKLRLSYEDKPAEVIRGVHKGFIFSFNDEEWRVDSLTETRKAKSFSYALNLISPSDGMKRKSLKLHRKSSHVRLLIE
ncbi:MAG: hypothetical protein HQL32_14875 [Planctomycetes bacterium]|nr:hypothetical protein [Planctomycetota bacterium]